MELLRPWLAVKYNYRSIFSFTTEYITFVLPDLQNVLISKYLTTFCGSFRSNLGKVSFLFSGIIFHHFITDYSGAWHAFWSVFAIFILTLFRGIATLLWLGAGHVQCTRDLCWLELPMAHRKVNRAGQVEGKGPDKDQSNFFRFFLLSLTLMLWFPAGSFPCPSFSRSLCVIVSPLTHTHFTITCRWLALNDLGSLEEP